MLDIAERDVVFGRVEAAEKSASSLDVAGPDVQRWLGKASLGYERQFPIAVGGSRRLLLGVGVGASLNAIPPAFAGAYGERWPVGFVVFLEARSPRMDMSASARPAGADMAPMPGM